MAAYYLYQIPSFKTSYLNETFPSHPWPLEHTRHAIGNAVHDFFNPFEGSPAINPHADVRETTKKIYIDVELPGAKSAEDLSLTWTNKNTLLLKANIDRPEISADEAEMRETAEDENIENQNTQKKNPIHLVCKERHIGTYARAFTFAIDVNHDSMKARLLNGILRIILEKQ